MPFNLQKLANSFDLNGGPLSDLIDAGKPNCFNTSLSNLIVSRLVIFFVIFKTGYLECSQIITNTNRHQLVCVNWNLLQLISISHEASCLTISDSTLLCLSWRHKLHMSQHLLKLIFEYLEKNSALQLVLHTTSYPYDLYVDNLLQFARDYCVTFHE